MQFGKFCCAIAILANTAIAQDQPPAFDVASVKPSRSTGGISNRSDPALGTWTNTPLSFVIRSAYVIQPDQLIGGPDWVNSDRWDIIASTEKPASWSERNRMLQTLLADRFQLKVHWETRQLPEYELVVGKGGPKLLAASGNRPDGTSIGRGLIDAHGITIDLLASLLRGETGRPVLDHTGLAGKYDIKLEWVPDDGQPNSGGDAPPADATGPSIFNAIQELGLKLKVIRGPVEVMVIDHVEKPSAN